MQIQSDKDIVMAWPWKAPGLKYDQHLRFQVTSRVLHAAFMEKLAMEMLLVAKKTFQCYQQWRIIYDYQLLFQ